MDNPFGVDSYGPMVGGDQLQVPRIVACSRFLDLFMIRGANAQQFNELAEQETTRMLARVAERS